MRYNIHCHIFNLQSIFNPSTAYILRNRLGDVHALPGKIADKIVDKLRAFIQNGGGFNTAGSDPNDFTIDRADFLGRIREYSEALRLAMLNDMDKVTDDMVQQFPFNRQDLTDFNVIFTPMMMDILVAPQPDPDPDDVFDKQLDGTKRQILRYPGRILPFYAVNPFRRNFVKRSLDALDQGGFVGVKLYPSLGYKIDAPGMDGVMHYCNDNDIPILMHCNHGGFKQNDATTAYCDPNLWGLLEGKDGYLDTYPKLKICFGHFGGEENFTDKYGIAKDSWTADILGLMSAYKSRVFADVSFHDVAYTPTPSSPNDAVRTYFDNLNRIMGNADLETQVLWGTDTWLLRLVCKELDYWGAFEPPGALIAEDFKLMSENNPRVFLGIDADNPKKNIIKYMEYMKTNAGWSDTDAQAWLQKAAS